MIGIVKSRHFCTNLAIDDVITIDGIGIDVDGVVAKVDHDAFRRFMHVLDSNRPLGRTDLDVFARYVVSLPGYSA